MSGCQHPLTNFALLLLLFLLYAVYPIPFITTNNFLLSEDFLLIDTCGASAILLTTVVGNALCLVIFSKIENAAAYLYILMTLADLLQPFFYLPGKLMYSWKYFRYNFGKEHPADYAGSESKFLNFYFSIRHGFTVFSMISFSLVCVLDFYAAANKIKKEKTSFKVKAITSFLTVITSIFLAWLYYVNTRNKWDKGVALSVLSYFIPIIVCTICLVLSFFIRNFLNTQPVAGEPLPVHQPSYKCIWMIWLSYVIFYTPWFVWKSQKYLEIHEKHHAMNMLLLIKPCANVFLLIEFDRNLKAKLRSIICDSYTSCMSSARQHLCCCWGGLGDYITSSRDKLKERISLSSSNTFVVVKTPNGVTLQNGNVTSRSLISSV